MFRWFRSCISLLLVFTGLHRVSGFIFKSLIKLRVSGRDGKGWSLGASLLPIPVWLLLKCAGGFLPVLCLKPLCHRRGDLDRGGGFRRRNLLRDRGCWCGGYWGRGSRWLLRGWSCWRSWLLRWRHVVSVYARGSRWLCLGLRIGGCRLLSLRFVGNKYLLAVDIPKNAAVLCSQLGITLGLCLANRWGLGCLRRNLLDLRSQFIG